MRSTHDYEDHEEEVARGRGRLEHRGGRSLRLGVAAVSAVREEMVGGREEDERGGRCGEAFWTISRRLRGKTDCSTQARAPMHVAVPVWNL